MHGSGRGRRTLVLVAAAAMAGSCASSHSLDLYDFSGRDLAVVSDVPPHPELLTGPLFISSRSAVEALLDVAARGAREIQARRVEEKLDSASARVDVGRLMEEETLRRASRHLGTEPASSEPDADFVLEVVVRKLGIEASDWDATAYFFLEAEATLLNRLGNREVWRTEVEGRDPVGPEIFAGPNRARDVVTAAVIASLSVDDMARTLEQLADYVAGRVTDRLRDDLAESRGRR